MTPPSNSPSRSPSAAVCLWLLFGGFSLAAVVTGCWVAGRARSFRPGLVAEPGGLGRGRGRGRRALPQRVWTQTRMAADRHRRPGFNLSLARAIRRSPLGRLGAHSPEQRRTPAPAHDHRACRLGRKVCLRPALAAWGHDLAGATARCIPGGRLRRRVDRDAARQPTSFAPPRPHRGRSSRRSRCSHAFATISLRRCRRWKALSDSPSPCRLLRPAWRCLRWRAPSSLLSPWRRQPGSRRTAWRPISRFAPWRPRSAPTPFPWWAWA